MGGFFSETSAFRRSEPTSSLAKSGRLADSEARHVRMSDRAPAFSCERSSFARFVLDTLVE